MRVLLVEDDQDIRFLFRRQLSKDGHDVTAVANGQAAEAELLRSNFDYAVLDYAIPWKEEAPSTEIGLEIMRLVSQQGIRFVVITGVAEGAHDGFAARDAGAELYLYKGEANANDRIRARLREVARTLPTDHGGSPNPDLPLTARRYADCYVLIPENQPEVVVLTVRGSRVRVTVEPPGRVRNILYDLSFDQPAGDPSRFADRWPSASTRRTSVGEARRWLRDHFRVSDPAHRHAPFLTTPESKQNDPCWTCDVRVLRHDTSAGEQLDQLRQAAKLRPRERGD